MVARGKQRGMVDRSFSVRGASSFRNRELVEKRQQFFFPAEEDFKVILMDRGNTQNSQFRNTAQELLGLFCNAAFVDFIINQWKQAVKRLQTGFDKDFRPGIGYGKA